MSNSFFPNSDSKLSVWAENYKNKIALNATALGLTPAQVTAEQAYCDGLIASITDVNDKKRLLKSSLETKNQAVAMQGGSLRIEIARHKMAVGYTNTIGEDLGIVAHAVTMDFVNYKPKIAAEYYGGFVRIKFKKLGVDGINLYHRKKGTTSWLFLARATKNPFDDHIVLTTAGQPEHWEYRAFGVIDDAEIGQPSDIVEMVYGG